MLDVKIIDSGADIGLQLKWVSSRIGPVANQAIRDNAPALERAARERAMNLRLGGKRPRGASDGSLRRALANAIITRVEHDAVKFVISGSRMPLNEQGMIFASVAHSFTHPVYGLNGVRVTQTGDVGWFARSIIGKARQLLPGKITHELERLSK